MNSDADRAAHALADSVTAPAGPSKSLPYEPTSAMLIAARERDPALPIETVRAIYWSMWRTAPTPPAQAADSVTAPAGGGVAGSEWKWVPVDATDAMVRATDKVNFENEDTDGTIHNVWNTMLAAAPTPSATPSAASIAWNALRDLTDPLGEDGVKIMGHVRVFAQRQYEARLAEGSADRARLEKAP